MAIHRYAIPILAGSVLAACNKGDEISCGVGTHLEAGECVADGPDVITNTITNPGQTITNTNPAPPGPLQPGHFSAPLVQLDEIVGTGGALGTSGAGQTHMHVSDVQYREGADNRPPQVIYCSYTFGVINVTNPHSSRYLAQGWTHSPITGSRAPGCIHLAMDENDPDIVYTTHHGNLDDGDAFLSGWDLNSLNTDPYVPTTVTLAPVQLPMLQEVGESYEGLDFEDGRIWVAMHEGGIAVFTRDEANGNAIERQGTYTTGLTNTWDIQVIGDIAYVGDTPGGLFILDVSDPSTPIELGQLIIDGQINDVEVDGTTAYLSAKSGGVVVVDVSDPTNPTLISTIETGNSVVQARYSDNKLAVANWTETRVYDVTDPANPEMVGAVRQTVEKTYVGDDGDRPDISARILSADLNDQTLFVGNWWVPYTFEVREGPEFVAPFMVLPETVNYLSFPNDLAPGESSSITLDVRNDGNAPLTLYDNWTDNPAFAVEPAQMLIQPGDIGTLTITFTASEGVTQTVSTYPYTEYSVEEQGFLVIRSDDPTQPERKAFLVGNSNAISIGDAMPETTATLMDGSEWSFTADALGSVTMLAYFATY